MAINSRMLRLKIWFDQLIISGESGGVPDLLHDKAIHKELHCLYFPLAWELNVEE